MQNEQLNGQIQQPNAAVIGTAVKNALNCRLDCTRASVFYLQALSLYDIAGHTNTKYGQVMAKTST
jgi:hypothetical protein